MAFKHHALTFIQNMYKIASIMRNRIDERRVKVEFLNKLWDLEVDTLKANFIEQSRKGKKTNIKMAIKLSQINQ